MELSQRLPLDLLLPADVVESLKEKDKVTNVLFKRLVATTCRYQRVISVEDCKELTREIFSFVGSCEYLRTLNLSGTAVDDLDFLPRCKFLVELRLARCTLSSYTGLEQCPTLRALDVRHTNFLDTSVLVHCQHLRLLDLGGTKAQDLEPLTECGRLQTLYLDGTPVTDLRPLAACSKLELVNIGFTRIDKNAPDLPVKKSIVVTQARSHAWFDAILKGSSQSLLEHSIQNGQWVNEMMHPLLEDLGMQFFQKRCHRRTPFFSFKDDALRATALHVAVLLGFETLIHFLVHRGADVNLKAWFGDVTGAGGFSKAQDLTPLKLAVMCGDNGYWSTTRGHFKRGIDTRKACAAKLQRIRQILVKDPELTLDMIKEGEATS